eukprot:TRINITY_DN53026_c0_g1_i1.p3 TRINITY_DN53026_c0_g1~~TRINITY_DN53026_c0_g1_i1.p3  ORF type:complete len:101 (+),score=23.31 TRINITY_DN53026_c0_g1_i1:99-401(+)
MDSIIKLLSPLSRRLRGHGELKWGVLIDKLQVPIYAGVSVGVVYWIHSGFYTFQEILYPSLLGYLEKDGESLKVASRDNWALMSDHHDRAGSMRDAMRKA